MPLVTECVCDMMAMKGNFLKNILGVDNTGDGGCYFGDTTTAANADVVVISAPWSVTSDFGRGATYTPDAIIDASNGKEWYDACTGISINGRVATAEIDYNIQESSEHLGREAERILRYSGGEDGVAKEYIARKTASVNEGFAEMNKSIYKQTKHWAEQGKRIAVVGGDHSVAFGAVKALSECKENLGVLFIDAHADFSREGEVFTYSHRSVARHIVEEIRSVEKLVEVGVRDIDRAEMIDLLANDKVELVLAEKVVAKRFEGESWSDVCREITERLPHNVYISLDIDALKIEFCNNTNSPVPGGMTFDEIIYLINCIVASGREIVGCDLSEVVSSLDDKMDAIVGARILAKMCVAMMRKE